MARQMKDSGVEWIGDIPEEWSKDKICRVCSLIGSGTTPKFDRFDLSSATIPWIQSGDLSTAHIRQVKACVTPDIIAEYSALKVYDAPFIVVAMYGASIGNTSISIINACVNQACCVLSLKTFSLRYMYYIIMACKPYFIYQGEGGGQPNISQEKIKQTRIPVPPPIEQQGITSYLDTKCTEIDKVVEQTRATIEEYKKLKQAIITEAVTKGVRGPRPMKPSGVEWIGDIPEEWSKDKIGRVCNLIGSGTTPKFDRFDLSSADIPWIQSGDLSSAHLHNVKTYVTRDIIAAHSALKVYEPPFIAVAMYGASIGNTSISSFSACVNQACCVLTPDTFNLSYLYYIIMACKPYFMYQGEGGGQPNISQEKIKQTWIPVPNPIEQQEIATYLDTKCAEIDRIIEKKEQLIDELGSYKKSLIYEYVTGKKEVTA